jgi:hypothetical protein
MFSFRRARQHTLGIHILHRLPVFMLSHRVPRALDAVAGVQDLSLGYTRQEA